MVYLRTIHPAIIRGIFLLAGGFFFVAKAQAIPVEEITITKVHAAFLSREVTAVEVVQAHLDRIAAYDQRGPILNSIISTNPKALEEAAALDAYLKENGTLKGPLHGIPVIVKDNIDVVGMPMTSGFQGWKEYYPPTDAFLTARLRKAGAIIIAKASLSEFARGGADNINSVLPGFARNPYNTAFATGGSSGGTGAAIAASFGIVGIGSDTGGSVRMPAAHNAQVGLRPTVGLISRTGMVPLNSVRDTAGPMARTVTDMAILLDVIAAVDASDPAGTRAEGNIPASYTASLRADALRGARMGVLRTVMRPDKMDTRIIEHFEKTIAELKAAGATIVDPFEVPELDSIKRPPQTQARFKADVQKFLDAHPGIPYPTVEEIAASKLVHPLHQPAWDAAAVALPPEQDAETLEGLQNEERYRQAFIAAMEKYKVDAIVFPVWAELPRLNGDRSPSGSLTFVASSLQWPAISVPMGYLGEGLPVGLQILGRAWEEERIIGYAYAYEQATQYRIPPPSTPPITR